MPNNQPGTPPPGGYQRPPGVPANATVDAYGNWFNSAGDFVGTSNAQAATPTQLGAQLGPPQVDSSGKPYRIVDGQKWYLPPMPHADPTSGQLVNDDGSPYDPNNDPSHGGGGLIHGQKQWNPQTGQYDTPLDWGKILAMAAAGVITAGAADAAFASTPALASTTTAAAPAPAASATLASNAAIPAGASDVGAGAATATYGPTLASSTTVPTATGTVAGGAGLTAAGTAGDSSTIPLAAGTVAGGTSATDAILRYLAPTAGNIVSSLIGANASSNATDAQQKYLQEALDYEKSRDSAAIALEGSRYGNYSSNIAPYLATGNSANARMASLLGLPANGSSGPGGGPVQPGPNGITTPAQTNATSTAAGSTIGAPTAPVTTGPTLPRAGATVTMKAPDGSTKQVDPSQVAHYQQMGAQVVNA